jgi:hypothetical protein
MYPHRIRLRGPWECEPLAAPETSAPRRIHLPCRWDDAALADITGRARFRRRFGYPGRIDAHERVWLIVAGTAERLEVSLNGVPLGEQAGGPSGEFDVTALLRPRNELVIDTAMPAERSGAWGEVALEVRCTAFLRKVRLWIEGPGASANLHVVGEVVGASEGLLELYVVCDRAVASYATVTAREDGQPFHLLAAIPVPREGQTVRARVDLVNGASVWYTVEHELVSVR